MTRKTPPKNVTASVRARLFNHARSQREDFGYVLTRYGIERLLFRLSQTKEADQFVLKGSMLFSIWTDVRHRTTRDVDLLSIGSPDLERLETFFRGVCQVPVEPDGLLFDPASVTASRIREGEKYEGVRVTLKGLLGKARVNLQIDVGFGDAITPGPAHIHIPTLLEQPTPTLASYPRETVVAEKLHALVLLGMSNSRMKDFFDLEFLSRNFNFDGDVLTAAVNATFKRRQTLLPQEYPVAFTEIFANDKNKQIQWRAFLRKSGLPGETDLAKVIESIKIFAWPIFKATQDSSPLSFWRANEGWG